MPTTITKGSKYLTLINVFTVLWISLFVIALFAGLSVTRAQTGANADVSSAGERSMT
jgi:hypothetical protein